MTVRRDPPIFRRERRVVTLPDRKPLGRDAFGVLDLRGEERGEDLARQRSADDARPPNADLPVKFLLVATAALVLFVPAAGSRPAGAPGITKTQILIGGTVPLSSQASSFGAIGPAANAYFKYVNAHGGVHGRKIKYLYRDDGYDPSRTFELTRELVEQDKVFAIFGSLGTAPNLAIWSYLNKKHVPQIGIATGCFTSPV